MESRAAQAEAASKSAHCNLRVYHNGFDAAEGCLRAFRSGRGHRHVQMFAMTKEKKAGRQPSLIAFRPIDESIARSAPRDGRPLVLPQRLHALIQYLCQDSVRRFAGTH